MKLRTALAAVAACAVARVVFAFGRSEPPPPWAPDPLDWVEACLALPVLWLVPGGALVALVARGELGGRGREDGRIDLVWWGVGALAASVLTHGPVIQGLRLLNIAIEPGLYAGLLAAMAVGVAARLWRHPIGQERLALPPARVTATIALALFVVVALGAANWSRIAADPNMHLSLPSLDEEEAFGAGPLSPSVALDPDPRPRGLRRSSEDGRIRLRLHNTGEDAVRVPVAMVVPVVRGQRLRGELDGVALDHEGVLRPDTLPFERPWSQMLFSVSVELAPGETRALEVGRKTPRGRFVERPIEAVDITGLGMGESWGALQAFGHTVATGDHLTEVEGQVSALRRPRNDGYYTPLPGTTATGFVWLHAGVPATLLLGGSGVGWALAVLASVLLWVAAVGRSLEEEQGEGAWPAWGLLVVGAAVHVGALVMGEEFNYPDHLFAASVATGLALATTRRRRLTILWVLVALGTRYPGAPLILAGLALLALWDEEKAQHRRTLALSVGACLGVIAVVAAGVLLAGTDLGYQVIAVGNELVLEHYYQQPEFVPWGQRIGRAGALWMVLGGWVLGLAVLGRSRLGWLAAVVVLMYAPFILTFEGTSVHYVLPLTVLGFVAAAAGVGRRRGWVGALVLVGVVVALARSQLWVSVEPFSG